MSSPSPLGPVVSAAAPYDRAKAVKEFDETKVGVKGLMDSGIKTIPPFFVHPAETLAALKPGPEPDSAPEIPTVDLSAVHGSRSAVVEQIRQAASTVGFFQVINHGVPEELLRRTLAAVKAFHEQPAEERAKVYRREMGKGVSYISNVDLFQSKAASWRDTIQIRMGPIAADSGEIPEVCKKEVIEWDKEVVRVAHVLYELLSEGLGLGAEKLTDMGLAEGRVMVGHYYPFCPQPDLTVGLNSHADPGALTVLLQDHIGGLQVETKQGWIHVKPQPLALVINIGDFLQIISNEAYKSAHHRVLANNSNEPRVSVAVFLNPSDRERLFEPLPELTSTEKSALYKNFTFHEFMTRFFTKELDEGQDEYENDGFIVDDIDDEEEQDEEEERADSDEERQKKKKRKKKEEYVLDEDDYELLEDNNINIHRWKESKKFKRLKKGRKDTDGEPSGLSDEEEFVGSGKVGQTAEEKLKRSLFGDDDGAPLEDIAEEEDQGEEEEDADIGEDDEMADFIVDEEELDENGAPMRYFKCRGS